MPIVLPAVRTLYGLSALAAAVQGGYLPPLYLVIESNGSTLYAASSGVTSIQTHAAVDLTGDSQIVLSPGLATQETVTFTARSGTADPYTYTLASTTANAHAAGDPVCRMVLDSDTMSQVVSEVAYDSTNNPGNRSLSVGGYSTGTGQWTMQFYLTGIQANAYIMTVGLSDSPTIGQGNLHAHLIVATNHVFVNPATAVDLEIDVPLTLA